MADIQTKGKLLADRIRAMHEEVSEEMDQLAERVEATHKAIPVAFNQAHAFIDHQQAEVQAIDDVLRSLSNLPLPGGDVGAGLSGSTVSPSTPQRDTVELKPAPDAENLPSGIPANIAAAINLNKG